MICRYCHKKIIRISDGTDWIHCKGDTYGFYRCSDDMKPDYYNNVNVALPVSRKEKLKRVLKNGI